MISDDAVKGVHYKKILQLYNDLMALDSSHDQYYKDEHSVALLHKVLSLPFSCESQFDFLLLNFLSDLNSCIEFFSLFDFRCFYLLVIIKENVDAQVTSSTESLSRHLFRYRNMNNIVCLRLNNLTLSRIAAVEKLLFVQMLDLSHNELHSAEGM